MPRSPLRGFSLVELLVVITIIVLLVAILVPAMEGAVLHGRRAICATNLHQLHVAQFAYAVDNNAVLAPSGWGTGPTANASLHVYERQIAELWLGTYLGNQLSVLFCPVTGLSRDQQSQTWLATWQTNFGWDNQVRLCTYSSSTNVYLSDATRTRGGEDFRVIRSTDPSHMMLFADMARWWATTPQRWELADTQLRPDRQPEGINRVTMNGAVEWRRFDQLQRNYWIGTTLDYYW